MGRNTITFDQCHESFLDDNRPDANHRLCAYCGDPIVIGDDRYILDDDHVHDDCWPAYAVSLLDASVSGGDDCWTN